MSKIYDDDNGKCFYLYDIRLYFHHDSFYILVKIFLTSVTNEKGQLIDFDIKKINVTVTKDHSSTHDGWNGMLSLTTIRCINRRDCSLIYLIFQKKLL